MERLKKAIEKAKSIREQYADGDVYEILDDIYVLDPEEELIPIYGAEPMGMFTGKMLRDFSRSKLASKRSRWVYNDDDGVFYDEKKPGGDMVQRGSMESLVDSRLAKKVK